MNQNNLLTIFTGLLVFIAMQMTAQVAINTDGSSPDSSAMLDVNSASRGFLPPRLRLTAADNPNPVVTPAQGLLVYNIESNGASPNQVVPGYYSWNVNRWIPVSPPAGSNPGEMAYWNGSGWVIIPNGNYGQNMVFCNGVPTWGGCFPLIMTDTVTNIVQATAISGGNVTSEGGTAVTARGICWDTINAPDLTSDHSTNGSGPGAYACTMTDLKQNKTYYVRAFATNSRGTAYGEEKSFTSGCVSFSNVTISILPSENPVASGTSVTFTATVANSGSMPVFQWIVNGSNAGTNSNIYSYIPQNNDVVACIITSSLTGCVTGSPATSNSITMTVNPSAGTYCPGVPTILYDGQTYNTVLIGSQCWLKENLNVGTKILGNLEQTNNSLPEKYCFGNLDLNCTVYGGLYQWDEAMQYVTTSGAQGICPTGWHIPSDAEWTTLIDFLGGGPVAGGKMKEAGTTHWASPNTGATNSSNFTSLPGDYRDTLGEFQALTYDAYFWSSSVSTPPTFAVTHYLVSNTAEAYRDDLGKLSGLSVRCLQN